MATDRNVCLAIGIGDAGGGLELLTGAVNAAKEMHAWATAMGYESRLLTDDAGQQVTLDRLKQELKGLLPVGSRTDRFVLYFAGHGMTGRTSEALWLLNDWSSELKGVAFDVLQHYLRKFGVVQIALIGDACRSWVADARSAEVRGEQVLGAGFSERSTEATTDRFVATQEGQAAYMIPGERPEDDKCIFSGVLLEGLWGLSKTAFSKRAPKQVLSQSLADYLRVRVREVAGRYRVEMVPETNPNFQEQRDVYYDEDAKPAVAASLGAWPEPPSLASANVLVPLGAHDRGWEGVTRGVFTRAVADALDSGVHTERFGKLVDGLSLADLMTAVQGEAHVLPAIAAVEVVEWDLFRAQVAMGCGVGMAESKKRQLEWIVQKRVLEKKQVASRVAQKEKASPTRGLPEWRDLAPQLTEGVVWSGPAGARAFGQKSLKAVRRGGSADVQWLETGMGFGGSASQALLELRDGRFVACSAMGGMITVVGQDESGAVWTLMQPGFQSSQNDSSMEALKAALARMDADELRVEEVADLATGLRMDKHVNPILGVISAYLYDKIADTGSIRRMASAYVEHYQAIPFDIVFLGDMQVRLMPEGLLEAVVPAQPKSVPRTDAEKNAPWTFEAREEARGLVAGRVPWMSKGWQYVKSPSAAERLMVYDVEHLAGAVEPSRFTTLSADGGLALARALRLELVAP